MPKNKAVQGVQIYIMRHGIATMPGSDRSIDDSERTLTPQGRSKCKQIGKGLARLGVKLDWIVTSPLVRASATAKIIAESLGTEIPMDFCEALCPGEPPEKLLEFLKQHSQRKRILVVGHEPDLSILAGRLIGAGRGAGLAFKKGGCCLVLCDQLSLKTPGRLLWWMTPRVLRAIS